MIYDRLYEQEQHNLKRVRKQNKQKKNIRRQQTQPSHATLWEFIAKTRESDMQDDTKKIIIKY